MFCGLVLYMKSCTIAAPDHLSQRGKRSQTVLGVLARSVTNPTGTTSGPMLVWRSYVCVSLQTFGLSVS